VLKPREMKVPRIYSCGKLVKYVFTHRARGSDLRQSMVSFDGRCSLSAPQWYDASAAKRAAAQF